MAEECRSDAPCGRCDERAGLKAGRLKYIEAFGPRRCKAKAESTGTQCRRWAERNSKICHLHGGHGKGPWNAWKRGDPGSRSLHVDELLKKTPPSSVRS